MIGAKPKPALALSDPLPPDLAAALLWCLVHDHAALAEFADRLDPAALPADHGLAAEVLTGYWREHGRAPKPVILASRLGVLVAAGKTTEAEADRALAALDRGEELRAAGAFDPAQARAEAAEHLRRWHAARLAVESIPALVAGEREALRGVASELDALVALGQGMPDPSSGQLLSALTSAEELAGELISDDAGRRPTGTGELDGALGGGLTAGELGVVQAFSGVGKTWHLTTVCAEAMRAGLFAVAVTTELSVARFRLRALAGVLGFDPRGLADRLAPAATRAKALAELEAHRAEAAKRGGLYIAWLDDGAPVGAVAAVLDEAQAAGAGRKPDVLVVDSADALAPRGKHDSGYTAQGETYRVLRMLAKERKLPVWTATQASRKAREAQVVSEAHVADSMRKVRVADVVVSLCQTTEEAKADAIRLYVAKNRNREAKMTLGPFKTGFHRGRLVDEG